MIPDLTSRAALSVISAMGRIAWVTLAISSVLLAQGCTKGEESLRKANVFFKNGEFDLAMAAYQKAASDNPESARAREGMGNVEFERKRYPQAIAEYRAALEISPESIQLLHRVAVAESTVGNDVAAVKALERAVALDPEDVFALHALGGIAKRGGDLGSAKKYQLAALNADPKYHAARYALGQILVDGGELPEAEREFTRLLQSGANALGEYGLARLAAKRGRWDEAAERLDRVLAAKVERPANIWEDAAFQSGWSSKEMMQIKTKLSALGVDTSTRTSRGAN